jgi:Domain of unknown function (DUF4082)
MSMLNLHNLKPLHNLKLRLLLFSIAAFLVFAGPAVTLQGHSKALVAEPPNELSLSNSSLAPVAVGLVNTADCSAITGRLDMPGQYVDIYINGVFKAQIPANRCSVPAGDCNGFRYTIPSTLKNGKQLFVQVMYGGTNTELSGSGKKIRCGAMLFPGSTPPGPVTSVSGEGLTWEQSNQITSIESGTITHIRFWKVTEESGFHTGHIWSDTGALLRTADFGISDVGTAGWVVAALNEGPLQIIAGTKYRVSYNVNSYGGKIISGLTSPYSKEPLTAWRGFYRTPSGTFPNTSSVSNFLADVILNVPQ